MMKSALLWRYSMVLEIAITAAFVRLTLQLTSDVTKTRRYFSLGQPLLSFSPLPSCVILTFA